MVNIFKRKRSDWMEGLLFAEELFQEGGIYAVEQQAFELAYFDGDFSEGFFDYQRNLQPLGDLK